MSPATNPFIPATEFTPLADALDVAEDLASGDRVEYDQLALALRAARAAYRSVESTVENIERGSSSLNLRGFASSA